MIAGYQRTSLIDFPGQLACVVFFGGCNMNCWFCHNRHILGAYEPVGEAEVTDFLIKRRGKLDGVVLSGGEPTLAPDLADFARMCRALGYKVKLDTNGLSDTAVKSLLSQNLFDYVAMDVKAPASKYADAACVPIDISKIRGSIELIKNSGVPYEFRTTFLPTLSPPDIGEIARDLIPGAKLYVIQRYRQVSNEELEVRSGGHGNHTAHSSLERGDGEADGAWRRPSSDFSRAAALAKPYVQEIMLR